MPPVNPMAPYPGGPLQWEATPPEPKGRNRMGLVAFIFAIVSLMLAIIPPLSGFTFIFAITAIVLAIVGLVRRRRKGLSTAALVIGILAWVISIAVFSSYITGLGADADKGSSESTAQEPTDEDSVEGTTEPAPVVEEPAPVAEDLSAYAEMPERDYALLVKDPDATVGQNFIVYGSIWQFDAASGKCSFLAATAPAAMENDWEYPTDAMVFGGDGETECPLLGPIVEGDVVKMWVTNDGSYSYDTQIGGNTTVPLFEVKQIEVL